ncbi:MAG TPA: LLM class flavin-dependent oxidoreductase [Pseudolysinimonas sp.]|nr:LLM class flavin-dependent oxidoreductase [Pseudolysinimonas sp.]
MTDIEFLGLVDNAYINVPYAGDRKSNYIDLPNRIYDPVEGQRVMDDALDVVVSLEKYGFDGGGISEQHNGPIGLWGNPFVPATWIASRTERMKILVNGPIMNNYQTPIRLAEEIAAVDTLSRGRLIVGLPMGHGMQHHSTGMNPATARARHAEAHDLLVSALNNDGPFEWNGDFFHVPYVNLWPRPTGPISFMLPGGGSIETQQLAARRRYAYQCVLSPLEVMAKNMQRFRDFCREEGYEPAPEQSAAVITLHVAETDAIAKREVQDIEEWGYQNFFLSPTHDNFPPGYVSLASMRGMKGGYRSKPMNEMTYPELLENRWIVAGSPQTVADGLNEVIEKLGLGRVIIPLTTGLKPKWMVDKVLTLFSEEVLPQFRPAGKPLVSAEDRVGFDTRLEYSVKRRKGHPVPAIVRNGNLLDVNKARLDGVDAVLGPWPGTTQEY